MPAILSRAAYAQMYGPTVGDCVWLTDPGLFANAQDVILSLHSFTV